MTDKPKTDSSGQSDHGPDNSSFTGDMAVIERLLKARGFRLSRGTYHHPGGDKTATVCVDRYDTPEWNGLWLGVGDDADEAQTAFILAGEAMQKWEEVSWLFSTKKTK